MKQTFVIFKIARMTTLNHSCLQISFFFYYFFFLCIKSGKNLNFIQNPIISKQIILLSLSYYLYTITFILYNKKFKKKITDKLCPATLAATLHQTNIHYPYLGKCTWVRCFSFSFENQCIKQKKIGKFATLILNYLDNMVFNNSKFTFYHYSFNNLQQSNNIFESNS